jgi:ATP-dependent DNA helicase DinG
VILTSATLALGGSFDSAAGSVGLLGDGGAPDWQGLDVGSPFDYPRQGILYLAKHLPAPGRDGTSPQALDELAELITAAGGRTAGPVLVPPGGGGRGRGDARAARRAHPLPGRRRDPDPGPAVRQGRADLPVRHALSLWQGVDVPGRPASSWSWTGFPFPRPDDPLASGPAARRGTGRWQRVMSVAAVHAALRLAQGVGRLVRTSDDKGVVASGPPAAPPPGTAAFCGPRCRRSGPPRPRGGAGGAAPDRCHRAAEVKPVARRGEDPCGPLVFPLSLV